MNITAEYDTRKLEKNLSLMAGLLFGRGATGGELEAMLVAENGQCFTRMGDAAGPKTLPSAKKKIIKDLNSALMIFPTSNLSAEQKYSSTADFTWLYAAPAALVGINDEDMQKSASAEQAVAFLRVTQKSVPRGNRYERIGTRGIQSIMRINRVAVSRVAYNGALNMLLEKTGQLRAACYRIAKQCGSKKRVPAWLEKKFAAVAANGKSVLNESGLRNGAESFIESTIHTPGLVSNDRLARKMQAAINASAEGIRRKAGKILQGAKYVFETGQTYFQKTDFGEN